MPLLATAIAAAYARADADAEPQPSAATIKLHHYGRLSPNEQGEKVVDPTHFGKNAHTRDDVRAAHTLPRSFFYIDPTDREDFFRGVPHHEADVPKDTIYDLAADPHKLLRNGTHVALVDAKRAGYHGVMYSWGDNSKIVNMFVPVKVDETPDPVTPEVEAEIAARKAAEEEGKEKQRATKHEEYLVVKQRLDAEWQADLDARIAAMQRNSRHDTPQRFAQHLIASLTAYSL